MQPASKADIIAFVVPPNFKIEQMVGAKFRRSRGFVPEKIPTNYLMNLVNQISSLWSTRSTNDKGDKWAYSVMSYEILNN